MSWTDPDDPDAPRLPSKFHPAHSGWRATKTKRLSRHLGGEPYYYNVRTRQSSWADPRSPYDRGADRHWESLDPETVRTRAALPFCRSALSFADIL